jgi:hypothetical protein
MKNILRDIMFLVLILTSICWGGTGTSGAQFLQLGGGSRSTALGGAYAALVGGVESVFINPAGLANLARTEAMFTHSEFYADLNYENVAFGVPINVGSITLSATALLSGDIEETTIDQPNGTGEMFSANDYSFNISYARRMTDKFSAGVTLKFILLNLAEVQARGLAFDMGGIYNTGIKNLRIGFAINNFGSDLKYAGKVLEFQTKKEDNPSQDSDVNANYESELFQLPLTFRVGLAFDLIKSENHVVTIVTDGVNPNDQDENLVVGLEYQFQHNYNLRVGYAGVLNGFDESGLNGRGLSAGAGARINLGTNGVRLDYSFQEHKYLSNISRFSVSFLF